jgi:ATP-binding cassette subfamily B protein RaxB
MPFLDKLTFGFGTKLPVILQTEATECGLACLAMVAGYHRCHTDLMSLRHRFPVSLKGATLAGVIRAASQLGLGTRPVKLDLDHLRELRLPCILHWNFNHFVVLKEVGATTVTIHDPSQGVRTLSRKEVSAAFTGVALEAWPSPGFKPLAPRKRLPLRNLMGRVTGLFASCSQIILLALALEVFALVAPFFMQWVIDHVIISADRNLLTTLAIGFGLLMLLQQAVSAMRAWIVLYMGTTLSLQWRANVFSHLIHLPIQYFEKRHLGDVVSRFGATHQIQHTLTTSFIEAILDGFMTIVTLGMMFLYSPLLAQIAVGAMLLYAAGRWAWYSPLRHATEEQLILAARQQTHFLETVRGVKAIKLFLRQDERRASWLSLLVEQINAELRTERLHLFYKVLNGLLFGIENILIIWLGARMVLDGIFTLGVLIAFMAYKGQFNTRVSALIDKFFELKMLQLQGERLADIVHTDTESSASTHDLYTAGDLPPTIEIHGLRYRYADQEPLVLDGISISVAAGESVAIAGPSGGGKTTLLNLLLGILQPTEGQILIGGVPLEHLGVDLLRKMVGTVLQDDVLFAGSIADNISFFDPHAKQDWIVQCAEMAAISADIAGMPMSYNTLVGDMGTVLSGGQKQRVLLARALYKRPRILLLDEATSHLDIDKEQRVNSAIKALKITRLIIAHRPETIVSADRAIMILGGKVVQDVSMSPLITPPGLNDKALVEEA